MYPLRPLSVPFTPCYHDAHAIRQSCRCASSAQDPTTTTSRASGPGSPGSPDATATGFTSTGFTATGFTQGCGHARVHEFERVGRQDACGISRARDAAHALFPVVLAGAVVAYGMGW